MATQRARAGCHARYTSPEPPRPIHSIWWKPGISGTLSKTAGRGEIGGERSGSGS
ncbi:MAG: hypothetical protein ACK55I_12605 [bacterium]